MLSCAPGGLSTVLHHLAARQVGDPLAPAYVRPASPTSGLIGSATMPWRQQTHWLTVIWMEDSGLIHRLLLFTFLPHVRRVFLQSTSSQLRQRCPSGAHF